MMTDRTRVFVYGTLKKGGGLHSLLSSSEFLGHFFVNGFKMYSAGGFPVIRPASEDHFIVGEVYSVDAGTLSVLDRAEGVHGGMYVREEVDLYDGYAAAPTAHVYVGGEKYWNWDRLAPLLPVRDSGCSFYEWSNVRGDNVFEERGVDHGSAC